MSKTTVTLNDIQLAAESALLNHGAAAWVAKEVALAVRIAEATGNLICGLYYLESYCLQLRSGRVKGAVEPTITRPRSATIKVDAGFGFAQAAFSRALPEALEVAREAGTCSLAVCHAHTCTSLGYFTEQIAQASSTKVPVRWRLAKSPWLKRPMNPYRLVGPWMPMESPLPTPVRPCKAH